DCVEPITGILGLSCFGLALWFYTSGRTAEEEDTSQSIAPANTVLPGSTVTGAAQGAAANTVALPQTIIATPTAVVLPQTVVIAPPAPPAPPAIPQIIAPAPPVAILPQPFVVPAIPLWENQQQQAPGLRESLRVPLLRLFISQPPQSTLITIALRMDVSAGAAAAQTRQCVDTLGQNSTAPHLQVTTIFPLAQGDIDWSIENLRKLGTGIQ
ncbi:hypothetical protein DXG01_005955, partial [Tephrocybe rancida]